MTRKPSVDSETPAEHRPDPGLLAAVEAQLGTRIDVHPWLTSASLDGIRHFALGVGDDNPLWWDEDYAKATAAGRMFAPPTFLYAGMSGGPWPDPSAAPEPLPGAVVLWAGDRWVWHSRTWQGETFSGEGEVSAVKPRRGSSGRRSIFKTESTRFRGEDGRLLAELHRTMVVLERHDDTMESADPMAAPPLLRLERSDRERIEAEYAAERRRGAAPRYAGQVRVGERLGPLLKGPLTTTALIGWMMGCGFPLCPTGRIASRYFEQRPDAVLVHPDSGAPDTAGAAHWDASLAREHGLARGYDVGSQRISWVAHLLTDWIGDAGELVELDVRLRRPNLIGDITRFTGEVTAKRTGEGEGGLIDCEISGVNQRGETTTSATAVVRLPHR